MHGHLLGYIHANKNIEAQEKAAARFSAKTDAAYVIDEKTIDAILEDAGVGQEYVDELAGKMDGMLTARAKLDFYDNMEALQKLFIKNVPTGLGLRDFMDRVGRDEIMNTLGLAGEEPYYIGNVYRTNYSTAHSVGRWKAAQASKLVTMLEYAAVLDGGTTDICMQLNGVRRKKSDPFWDKYYTPNHYQERSQVLEYTESYVALNGIKESGPVTITAEDQGEDFAVNPGQSDDWMKPTKGMKKRLEKFGDDRP